jgi:hypothetical protein
VTTTSLFSPSRRPALFQLIISCRPPCWPGWADHFLEIPGGFVQCATFFHFMSWKLWAQVLNSYQSVKFHTQVLTCFKDASRYASDSFQANIKQ